MKTYAIWKDKKVIGYIELTEQQKELLNGVQGIGVYFGFDNKTNPEKYLSENTNLTKEEIVEDCQGILDMLNTTEN